MASWLHLALFPGLSVFRLVGDVLENICPTENQQRTWTLAPCSCCLPRCCPPGEPPAASLACAVD